MATNEELKGVLHRIYIRKSGITIWVIIQYVIDRALQWGWGKKTYLFKEFLPDHIWNKISLKAKCILLILQDRGVL